MDSPVVACALVPGFPHLLAEQAPAPAWKALGEAARTVGDEIRRSRPDAVVAVSTQWFTVLGNQFQVQLRPQGRHVDENWYDFDFGTFDYELPVDVALAGAWAAAADEDGFQAHRVDYAGFPIDTGTLTAQRLLDPDGELPWALMSVNLYAGIDDMHRLGQAAARAAARLGRRVAVVAISGLSSGWTGRWISPDENAFDSPADDEWNRQVLELISAGQANDVLALLPDYAAAARADSRFRAFPFLVGAAGLTGPGSVREYGPVWGAGAAVITWKPDEAADDEPAAAEGER